jgi:hypothetical protein
MAPPRRCRRFRAGATHGRWGPPNAAPIGPARELARRCVRCSTARATGRPGGSDDVIPPVLRHVVDAADVGVRDLRAIRTSPRKRRSRAGSSESEPGRNLSATDWPSFRSSARCPFAVTAFVAGRKRDGSIGPGLTPGACGGRVGRSRWESLRRSRALPRIESNRARRPDGRVRTGSKPACMGF